MERVYERQLALWEAFRRLGFLSEEIFFSYNKAQPIVVVRADGKQFVVKIESPVPPSERQYIDEWKAAVDAWNGTMTEDEHMRIFHTYITDAGVSVPLLTGLLAAGFELGVIERKQKEEVRKHEAN